MPVTHRLQSDVVIVGAGTSGCYFAWRLGQAGFRTLVLEKRPLEELGQHMDIFHMDQVRFEEFGLPLPTEEDGELIGYYPTGLAWSPDRQVREKVRYAFYVMHKPAFQRRMHGYVFEAGGEILEQVEVTEPIVENGFVVGVRALRNGVPLEVRGKIVADASGINGVVRTRLSDDFGVENDPIRDEDTLFVCLEFRDGLEGDYPTGLNFYPLQKAFWNPSRGKGAILGIGQPGGYEYAWQKHREWREEYFGNPGRVLKRMQGKTPYRRSPYSLVGNGFMVLGDAAFQTKPFSGEGVTSSFTACQIAAEVAAEALRRDDVSRKSLWDYNVRYFLDQGAKFASMFVQLPAAAELSRREVDYLFHHGIIFSGEDFRQMNLNYETEMGLGQTISMALKLVWGVLSGQFSFASLKRLLSVSSTAAKIKALYQRFPDTPAQFQAWVAEAKVLWGET
ncbi:MAG: NAD(P)/FAD-dependent oxidoreductase [Chloroflexota bacterium]|nr:NAD(P)/FAD-dependent oxidoreductase [Chloroflexota bacterium]